MTSDERYMQRCLDLARLGAGYVSPNPMVGAILVHDNRIIGEGWHQAWGQAHAEVLCFRSVAPENEHLIPQSTLYCSLEPCSHYGKTPPCADLVISKQVKRVVISTLDPNPVVAGNGVRKIREAGIEVQTGVLTPEAFWMNRVFFTWIRDNRPYIILKWAESADGFMGMPDKNIRITGPLVQRLLHRWRSESDAILIGAGTAQTDNPRLDSRLYSSRNPLRVLLDGNGSVPGNIQLLQDEGPALIFGPMRADIPAHKTVTDTSGAVALPFILETLKTQRCASLLVEGGAMVLHQFLQQGLWDEIRIFRSAKRLDHGIESPSVPKHAHCVERYVLGGDAVDIYCAVSPESALTIFPDPVTLDSSAGFP